jgi:predicted Rossmann fold nucleotide-binding protein DprA/Smf involved in DNA uptake
MIEHPSPENGSPESVRAALLLTNRLVTLDAKPLPASEFWKLVERIDLADLLDLDVAGIVDVVGCAHDEAVRSRTLLDASTAFTFEQERLLEGGVTLVSALDERFPAMLRERLGLACPPFLLVAGALELFGHPALGVVGSRDASPEALDVASDAARTAAGREWPVVSGLARGVDQAAMAAAIEAGGHAIGVPADGILKASRNAEVRRGVHDGRLCLASPFAPSAPFRAGNAIGRNKIIYALSQVAFVAAADKGAGGTWAGANEAIGRGYAHVAVWTGAGSKEGNAALVTRGATPITDVSTLFDLDPAIPPPSRDSLF